MTMPADTALRRFFREHPEMGRRDRAAVAETVFDVLRNRRLYAHLAQSGDGPIAQRLAAVSRIRRGLPVRSERADGSPPDWLARARDIDPATLPFAIRFSLPDWLAPAIESRADAAALAAALLEPAPLDLRVNDAKGGRDAAIATLAEDGIEADPLAIAPLALRVKGKPALEASRAFVEGLVEVQDAGSQLLAMLVGPKRGQTVVDLCAGAGGKTLAMAAAMRSTGQVFACDVSAQRLLRLRPRLQRAGATNVQPMAIDSERDPKLGRLAGRADAVLVDAPCSGTGTLRRNPDLKWRGDPTSLGRLLEQQQSILEAAARLVKPGGVLVYATCSLLPEENERQAERFEAAHPEFVREPARTALAAQGAGIDPADPDGDPPGLLRLLPHRDGVDGFFAARWKRAR
ncbi:RsmB/NOP family class I SAM-dependent RNA methyltransferase [Zeimonas sediminis]|uniref:RsmB/NOP family class I SAM-dependent RNA methyltransferase n=1 Tax=Zeimonas sediminis TaxID=2944268 RepID=UPI003AF17FA8